jgi:hypothetical protein
MKAKRLLLGVTGGFAAVLVNQTAVAQPVLVTVKLESSQIAVGASTTLHVFAQVAPAQRASVDRIFSWNVDLLNSNGAIADASGAITKPVSDQDPQISSSGTMDGSNRRSVYDTFMNLPGAGVSAPVELFSVPVKGLAQGSLTLKVQVGTGVPALGADFIVAPLGGGDPLIGADYSQASTTLTVGASVCQSHLTPLLAGSPGSRQITINFTLCPGQNHTVEYTDDLLHPNWQALSGAPQNSGSLTDSAASSHRFYRVRQTSATGP